MQYASSFSLEMLHDLFTLGSFFLSALLHMLVLVGSILMHNPKTQRLQVSSSRTEQYILLSVAALLFTLYIFV